MLAKRPPTILPSLSLEEAIQTTKIHSVLRLLGNGKELIPPRVFRLPHHLRRGIAQSIDDMRISGYRLHRLKGKAKGRWSISVSGNWRLTFEFDGGDVRVLDYEDYH